MLLALRGTIRFRIAALAAVAVAAVLIVAAVGLVSVQRDQLTATIDSTLVQRANDLAALIASDDELPSALPGVGRETLAQLVLRDGHVVASTPNLDGDPPLPIDLPPTPAKATRIVTGLVVDNDVFRVLSRRVETGSGPSVLHVGASLDGVTESARILTASLAMTIPIVVAILAWLVWWLVGRTLAPVERIRSEVAEIGSAALHRRVPEPSGGDEIGRLARTMNEMLDRLETSAERQQRFVADASHELRSPLTRMRAELEVESSGVGDAHFLETHMSVLEEVIGLQQLVDDLLHLARTDAGEGAGRVVPVDLDDLVLREVQRLEAQGRVEVDMSQVSAAHVIGDPQQLARAIRNLLDNAERHAYGSVILSLAETAGEATFTVSDDGPGIPLDEHDRIFERFGRLDLARSRGSGGTGLGLAITREIIARHGGTVNVDPNPSGARFVVRLPMA